MKFKEAMLSCHVRSAIYRTGDPTKIYSEVDLSRVHPALKDLNRDKVGTVVKKLYWKNRRVPLEEQVSIEDQRCEDWEEYDPRDYDEGSLFSFND